MTPCHYRPTVVLLIGVQGRQDQADGGTGCDTRGLASDSKMRGRERTQDVNGAVVPVIVLATVSVTAIVWLPAVLSVTVKVPVPLVNVVLAGGTAWVSLLVKDTVPV